MLYNIEILKPKTKKTIRNWNKCLFTKYTLVWLAFTSKNNIFSEVFLFCFSIIYNLVLNTEFSTFNEKLLIS